MRRTVQSMLEDCQAKSTLLALSTCIERSAFLERNTTDGATDKPTPPCGAFLPTRHDHDNRALQLADCTIHDYFASQWPRQPLCGSRVKRPGGPGLCGTDRPSGNGLFRLQSRRHSHPLFDGADHL